MNTIAELNTDLQTTLQQLKHNSLKLPEAIDKLQQALVQKIPIESIDNQVTVIGFDVMRDLSKVEDLLEELQMSIRLQGM